MAKMLNLKSYTDKRGCLTVIEEQLDFVIQRVFYIYNVDNSIRGGHRHKVTKQAVICIKGQCIVSNNNGKIKEEFVLNTPDHCLILEPNDWHTMHHFSKDSILFVLASTKFDPTDYIYEPYYD